MGWIRGKNRRGTVEEESACRVEGVEEDRV